MPEESHLTENLQIDVAAVLDQQMEEIEAAQEELKSICGSWDNVAWEELDWSKIKDLQVRDIFAERTKAGEMAQNRICITCDKFVKHVRTIMDLLVQTTS